IGSVLKRVSRPALALVLTTSILSSGISVGADNAPADDPLSEIVVTATRIGVSSFNVPAAISTVSADELRNDALGVNLSDDIAMVPGLLARNRYNYAQDQQ